MKIEKLTDNKIRIILDIDDLIKKNIDVHSLIKNTDGTQKFFKNILKQAQKEVNFDVQDSKLLIEAYISTDGFFVLTFTKISTFCTYLNNTKLGNLKKFAKNISLYEYSSNYFLVFSEINTDFENTSLFYISISEFAKLASNSSCFASKLVEYGKTIFKNNAIQNGIKYFETNIN